MGGHRRQKLNTPNVHDENQFAETHAVRDDDVGDVFVVGLQQQG